MKKRLFPLLLVLALCLTGCPKEEQGIDYTPLQNALSEIEKAPAYYFSASIQAPGEIGVFSTHEFKVRKQDSGDIIETASVTIGDGVIKPASTDFEAYYCRNEGYLRHPNGIVDKHINAAGFRAEDLIQTATHAAIPAMKEALAAFGEMLPAYSVGKDGRMVYTLENVTISQYVRIINILSAERHLESFVKRELEALGDYTIDICAQLLENGTLEKFEIDVLDVREGGNTLYAGRTYYFNVDPMLTIQSPSYVTENFIPQNGSEVIYWTNGQAATYRCVAPENEMPYMQFVGCGRNPRDSYVVENYTVFPQVESLEVRQVISVIYDPNNNVALRNIVVPAGIAFDLTQITTPCGCNYPSYQTDFYLEAQESTVDTTYLVEGEHVKEIYFAGQWELKDGTPTPITN